MSGYDDIERTIRQVGSMRRTYRAARRGPRALAARAGRIAFGRASNRLMGRLFPPQRRSRW